MIFTRARTNIFDVGDLLLEAKEQCARRLANWLHDEFGWCGTRRTEDAGCGVGCQIQQFANLKLATTLYRLADHEPRMIYPIGGKSDDR
jgi:hypothetical protein